MPITCLNCGTETDDLSLGPCPVCGVVDYLVNGEVNGMTIVGGLRITGSASEEIKPPSAGKSGTAE